MELHLIIALPLAFGIGLSLELLGSGGSIITLPVLVYVAGVRGERPARFCSPHWRAWHQAHVWADEFHQ